MTNSRCAALRIVMVLALSGAALALAAEPQDHDHPRNHDDLETELIQYHDDGTYDRLLREVAARVIAHLREEAPKVKKPALVLDIDETALSNWPKLRANHFAFFPTGPCDLLPAGPCGEDTWERLGVDAALEPVQTIYRAARSIGVTVFFITGRNETFRAATEQNLHNAGYPVWAQLYMEPEGSHFSSAVDFKSPRRKEIEDQGYTIIANVGDQQSDLTGEAQKQGFRLPNPFYFIP